MKVERFKPAVTVAAVIERNGKFLLVEEHTRHGLKLNNPAGHIEPNESFEQAVVREVLEESAHPFVPSHFLGVYYSQQSKLDVSVPSDRHSYVRFAFAGQVGEPDLKQKLDDGIERFIWLSYEEIKAQADKLRNPVVLRCIEDYLAGVKLPLNALYTDTSVYEK